MTLEAAANWAVIFTAGIAMFALMSGALWWYWVVRRWRQRITDDIKTLVDIGKMAVDSAKSQNQKQWDDPEGDHTQGQLDVIAKFLGGIHLLLFYHFLHDHAFKTPNREFQEIIDMLANLSLQSPIAVKRDKEDA